MTQETSTTAIGLILKTCREIKDGRTSYEILSKQMEELGEMATEIAIKNQYITKLPGKDGILGEGADVLITTVDQIFNDNPDITEQEIATIVARKLAKWKGYYDEGLGRQVSS